jgi:predicted nuclease of predicted toxin-antitoxin system
VRLTFAPNLPVISVASVGAQPNDSQIWEFARQAELVIVSKDADFSDRIIVQSPPPWGVHLRFGNLRKKDFHALLARVWPQIEVLHKSHKLVNVHADRLEGIG